MATDLTTDPKAQPREIDHEAWWEALECLPPLDWRRVDGAESFTLSEPTPSAEPPAAMSGDEWADAQLARIDRDIDWHNTQHAEEVRRTEERNRWLAALHGALPPAPAACASFRKPAA